MNEREFYTEHISYGECYARFGPDFLDLLPSTLRYAPSEGSSWTTPAWSRSFVERLMREAGR